MRSRVLPFITWVLILTFACGGFAKPDQVIACTVSCTGTEFGIATDPPNSFLQMNNMAPGDLVTADLTVKNTGQHDFSYKVSAARQTGDESLFNKLLLELLDADGRVRYSGNFTGLADLEMGNLSAGNQEVLTFTVTFPVDAENPLQGKATSVEFVFAARSHEGDIGDGSQVIFEPPVINNHFELKIDSTVPIKFHLVKSDGSMDSQLHPYVVLEVIGPNSQGVTVTYAFKLSDGTLRFDNNLRLPHYIANFATRSYPVQPLGWYTARVVEQGAILGSITFQADTAPGTSRSNSP